MSRRSLLPLLLICLIALLPLRLAAQNAQGTADRSTPATLIADTIAVVSPGVIVASGHVEVLRDGTRLRASKVTYYEAEDRLEIDGPITLTDARGTLILANEAALSADMTQGIILGARLVLDRQMQIAADRVTRVGGRYAQMEKTVASSCRICAKNPVPIWQIRAEKIIHDESAQQLYFYDAQFRIMDIPVMYLPRLRLPDPTLKRATGFLVPSVRTTNKIGTGLKLPYFIAIGDHKDLTLTPYVTTEGSRTLEARYRQAFRTGEIEINGALTRDRLLPGQWRGYLDVDGQFDLPRGYVLSFGLERVSDIDYLGEYGYPQKDRLRSDVTVQKTTRHSFAEVAVYQFETLRTTEVQSQIPSPLATAQVERRFYPGMLGGRLDVSASALSLSRDSDTDILGRDLSRIAATADWRRSWHLPHGIEATLQARGAVDHYRIDQDSSFADTITRSTGFAAMELRWPLEKTGRRARHLIEPVVQLVWSEDGGPAAPNEDSVLVEFDEGNLFSFSRFPGSDVYERGARANLGLTWTRFDPAGWSSGLTVGRVVRADNLGQFTTGSGLRGTLSDWLVVGRIYTAAGLSLTNRAVIDDTLSPTRNELRLALTRETMSLASSYIWLEADAAEGRASDTSEVAFDGSVIINGNWFATADVRYDFIAHRASESKIGLGYRNECVSVDLSLSRSYASSTNVKANTDFGLSVTLNGFGDRGGTKTARRKCIR